MKLKTLDEKGDVILRDYTDEELRVIFRECDGYVLRCVRSSGKDYGGSQCREDSETRDMEIIPERILVRNGHFSGVLIQTVYDYYNGGGEIRYEEAVLLTEDADRGSARSGYSFSNDDHSRWDYTDYYLVKVESEE